MSNSLKIYPTNLSRGSKNFLGGASPPLRPPGYAPEPNPSPKALVCEIYILRGPNILTYNLL